MINKLGGVFVTGTDTGVGKTYVCCGLVRAFVESGLRVVGMKPIAAGCELYLDDVSNEDTRALLAAGNVKTTQKLVTPYTLVPPIAPHIAAQQAGIEINFEVIRQSFLALKEQANLVVVEGVGGFRVPLNSSQDISDLAKYLNLPVILVVGMRLGCINHALLSSAAIVETGLPFSGWVANCIDQNMLALEENIATLRAKLPAPLLGIVPYQKNREAAEKNSFTEIAAAL